MTLWVFRFYFLFNLGKLQLFLQKLDETAFWKFRKLLSFVRFVMTLTNSSSLVCVTNCSLLNLSSCLYKPHTIQGDQVSFNPYWQVFSILPLSLTNSVRSQVQNVQVKVEWWTWIGVLFALIPPTTHHHPPINFS